MKREVVNNILRLLSEETKRLKKQSPVAIPVMRRPMGRFSFMDANISESSEKTISVFRGEGGGGEGGSWNGAGIYFSDSKAEASLYGDVKEYEITLNNPFELQDIEDTSVQGSGLIRLFANTDGLRDIDFHGRTFKELNQIISNLENEVNANSIDIYDGNNEHFKHVSYEYDGKDYLIYNRTKNEYENLEYMKKVIIDRIIYEKYKIERLPIRVNEAMNPHLFSEILQKNGYDGIIANNSTVSSGHEYVVFDRSQIKEKQSLNESTRPFHSSIFKPVPTKFDNLKWPLTDLQKHFLDDFINIPEQAIKEGDLVYASKRTGIPVLSIKSIRNTYGKPELGYAKEDVIKGSSFDANHKGPTAKEMGLIGKDLPKEIDGKLFPMNQNPNFRGMSPVETLYNRKHGKNGGLHKKMERELPNYMYEWLMYFVEGTEKMKINESKLLNDFHSSKFDKYKFVMFSFDIVMKESKAHPYDLASNMHLPQLKEFEDKVKEFNDTFGTNFVIENQYTGDDGYLKVVIENAQTTDGKNIYNREFLDFSKTDIDRMIEYGVYETSIRSIT